MPPRVCDTCGAEKNVSSYRPQSTATTCRQCQRTKDGWDKNEPKTCDTCGKTKRRKDFTSASAPTCKACSRGSRVASAPPEVKERLEHKAAVKEEVRKVRKKTGVAPTPRQVSAIDKELAARVLSRRRLLPFIQRFNPDYQAGWVHHDICRRLERFAEQIDLKQSPRLMLLCPPRSGKSEIASRNFPAWYLGARPKHEVVASSHTGSLALDFSRRVREITRDPAYGSVFPDMRLDPNTQALEKWMTTTGGSYTAVGVGGSLTGKGAHCIPLWQEVLTPDGPRTFEALLKGCEQAQKVLAFDGSNIRECEINGYVLRESDHYYRVETTTGAFDATGEHPVCVGFEGAKPLYRRVDDLREGESLVVLNRTPTQGGKALCTMSSVRDDLHEGTVEVPVCGQGVSRTLTLLFKRVFWRVGFALQLGGAHLRGMWGGLQAPGERTREEKFTRGLASVLLQRVLRALPFPNLRRREAPQLQLDRADLHAVQHEVHAPEGPCGSRADDESVLQSGLLWGVADWEDYPSGYSRAWGEILPTRVQAVAERGDGTPAAMRCLRGTREGSAPQGRGQREQQPGEPRSSVPEVSHEPPHDCTHSRIERITRVDSPLVVGDLEVEGSHNFIIPGNYLLLNCLIVDDPVKDLAEADSATIRDSIFGWYGSTARTRLAPGGGVLLIQTWWNDDDLAGRLQAAMKEGGEQFEVVKYPAINEGYDEYLGPDDQILAVFPGEKPAPGSRLLRRANSALHPERYDLKELLALKNSYEAAGQKRIWSALYQQNPIPDEGLHFTKDMFQWYDDAPDLSDARIIQAWDFAITEKQASDWTVGICIAQLPDDDLYVLDMRRFRSGDSIAIVDTLIDFFRRHKAFVLGVEDGQIWKAMAALFQKRCREERIYPNLHLNRPLTDKQVRASPLRGRMQQGKVFFPRKAQWVGALEQELLRFPAGKHDDTVDALAWAVQTALNFIAPTTTRREPQIKSWRDKIRGLTGEGGGFMSA